MQLSPFISIQCTFKKWINYVKNNIVIKVFIYSPANECKILLTAISVFTGK